jgi:hypothetical protein
MALILAGIATLAFTDSWWPALYGVVGIPLAIWCFLRGRLYDALLVAVLFTLGWATADWDTGYAWAAPVLISVAAIYTLVRESMGLDPEGPTEQEEEIESEIDEDRGS